VDWTSWRYIGWQWVSRVLPAKATLVDTALSLMSLFCATGAFDADAFMLDGLPAWPAHLEYQEICGPSPGQALHRGMLLLLPKFVLLQQPGTPSACHVSEH
jgi:hypothetical protein